MVSQAIESIESPTDRTARFREGNGNGNGKQLELNACMLAPTPLVSDVPNRCQEDVPYGYNKNEVDHQGGCRDSIRGLANQLTCWKIRLWLGKVLSPFMTIRFLNR